MVMPAPGFLREQNRFQEVRIDFELVSRAFDECGMLAYEPSRTLVPLDEILVDPIVPNSRISDTS